MPFTLDQLNFLGVHVGVAIPPEFIENKRHAEEFKKRVAGLGARGDEIKKRSDAAKFIELLKQAQTSAAGKDFAASLKLLDQVEAGLAAPDAPPPTAPPPPPPVAAPAQTAPSPTTPAGLLAIWREAKEQMDKQISQLQNVLRQTRDPRCLRIAEMGLNGVTGKLQVGLQVALTECEQAGGRDPKLGAKAMGVIGQFKQFLQSDTIVALCEANPFGVKCDIRATLLPALNELEGSLKG